MASPIAELRALAPHRPLTASEARRVAELQAARLLTLQGVDAPPVPEQLIEYLPRLRVEFLPGPISGSVQWLGSQWLITVDSRESWVRQRWSLAHEFKHALDAPLMATLYPTTSRGSAHQRQERAAHHFAAALLMPKAWVKSAFCNQGIQNERTLARHFQVSVAALRIRLVELGLASPAPIAAGGTR